MSITPLKRKPRYEPSCPQLEASETSDVYSANERSKNRTRQSQNAYYTNRLVTTATSRQRIGDRGVDVRSIARHPRDGTGQLQNAYNSDSGLITGDNSQDNASDSYKYQSSGNDFRFEEDRYSSAHGSRSVNPASARVCLSDMPPRILRCIIGHLIDSPVPGFVDQNSLARAKDAYALCQTNSKMYYVFLGFLNSMYVAGNKTLDISGEPLARLSSKSLRHLYMSQLNELAPFISTLARSNVSLVTLMLYSGYFTRPNCEPVKNFSNSLVSCISDLILSSRMELRFLHIDITHFKSKTIKIDCDRLAPALQNLIALSITGASVGESYLDLIKLLTGPREGLRHLVLRNVYGLKEDMLKSIASICPQISRIEFENVFLSKTFASDLAILLGPSVRHFDVRLPKRVAKRKHWNKLARSPANELLEVTSYCANLDHIFVKPYIETCIPIMLEAVSRRFDTLRSLAIDISLFSPFHVEKLASAAPGLRRLQICGSAKAEIVIEFCRKFGGHLYALHIGDKFKLFDVSSAVLCAIGRCNQLRELTLHIARVGKQTLVRPDAVHELLRGVGANLVLLDWIWNIRWKAVSGASGILRRKSIPELLSGADLARCIWTYCKRLEVLQIQLMEPPDRTRHFDPAFSELTRRLPAVELYLERPRPSWLGRTWSGEEVQY